MSDDAQEKGLAMGCMTRTLTEVDLKAITDAIGSYLHKVPRELKDVLQSGFASHTSIPTSSPANYAVLKTVATEDGLWIQIDVNHYRIFEYLFTYSEEYRFPKTRPR